MKKVLFASLSLISIAMFGCATQTIPANTQATVNQQNNVGTQLQSSMQSQQQASQSDNTAYGDALNKKDTTLCMKIQNDTLQKQCLNVVGDQKIMDEALSKHDKTLCQKISQDFMKLNCETMAAAPVPGSVTKK